jgi:hypothetical protein
MSDENKGDKQMTTRGYSVEEGDRLNNFAIEPKVYVDDTPRTGWTQYAENLNGRLAMIGFVSLLAVEALSGQSLIGWFTNL